MPQEAWVVKCYSCKKFQVQLKKQAKKWKCVVCGSKQDLMTIYFTGQPCDCRVNVQNLNAAEGKKNEELLAKITHENQDLNEYFNDDDDFELKDRIESADYEMQKADEKVEMRLLDADIEDMFGNPHEDIDEYLDF